MDQFIPGLAAAVQQALQTELPAGFAGVVVGDDDFLIFTARRMGHTVGAHNAENVEVMIQLANVRAVVVGDSTLLITDNYTSHEPAIACAVGAGAPHGGAAVRRAVGQGSPGGGAAMLIMIAVYFVVLVGALVLGNYGPD